MGKTDSTPMKYAPVKYQMDTFNPVEHPAGTGFNGA